MIEEVAMPVFECPTCDQENEVEWEDMPERAAADRAHTCRSCGQKMRIGWVAEIDVREIIGLPTALAPNFDEGD